MQADALAARRQRAEELAQRFPPVLVAADRVAATVAQGVHGRRRVGIGDAFWQFRAYEQGDSLQIVDWRQSAKRERLYVRQNEWEAAESVWLWRDGSPSMHYRSARMPITKRERAEILLLATASLLVRGGERIALLGGAAPPQTGRATLERIAVELDGRVGAGAESLPPWRELPRYAGIVLLGDFLSPLPELETRFRRFATGGVRGHLCQVLDPAEEDYPFDGRTRFEGLEGEGDYLASRAERLRGAYHERLEAHREGLREICKRLGWSYASHRTDRPAETALLGLYTAIAGVFGR